MRGQIKEPVDGNRAAREDSASLPTPSPAPFEIRDITRLDAGRIRAKISVLISGFGSAQLVYVEATNDKAAFVAPASVRNGSYFQKTFSIEPAFENAVLREVERRLGESGFADDVA
jgi:hypothetical protein